MPTPNPLTATSASRAYAVRDWLGPTLSAACLIHCVAMVALPPLLPALFATQVENPLVEQVLWGTSIAAAAVVAHGRRAHLNAWIKGILAAAFVVGIVGHLGEIEALVHASFTGLLTGQLVLVWRTRKACGDHC